MSFINFYGMYLFGGNKNQINPLKSMGLCPGAMLPLWAYKSKLLTPQAKA